MSSRLSQKNFIPKGIDPIPIKTDPHKDRWKQALGGAVSGIRHLVPAQGPLAREKECCTEGIANRPRSCAYCGPRMLRVRNPTDRAGASTTISSAACSRAEDCDEPEIDHYASREPWYTQFQSTRPCFDTVWGSQMTAPIAVGGINAAAMPP